MFWITSGDDIEVRDGAYYLCAEIGKTAIFNIAANDTGSDSVALGLADENTVTGVEITACKLFIYIFLST